MLYFPIALIEYFVKEGIATYHALRGQIQFHNCSYPKNFEWVIENKVYSLPVSAFYSMPEYGCNILGTVLYPNVDGIEWVFDSNTLQNYCFSVDFEENQIGLAKFNPSTA